MALLHLHTLVSCFITCACGRDAAPARTTNRADLSLSMSLLFFLFVLWVSFCAFSQGKYRCTVGKSNPPPCRNAAHMPARPHHTPPCPRARGGFSPRWGFTCRKRRIWLGLADLSLLTPSGTFFREVHPASEMGRKWHKKKACCFAKNDQNGHDDDEFTTR